MENFALCYGALKLAFAKRNIPFPPDLANILDPVNDENQPSTSSSTNNNDDDNYLSDEYEFVPPIQQTRHGRTNRSTNIPSRAGSQLGHSYIQGTITATTNSSVNSPDMTDSFLETPNHVQYRRDLYKQLYKIVYENRRKRGLTNARKETYEWPPLIKQIVRCRYPSSIRNYECYTKDTIIFTLDTFIDVFQ
jgi:hypothetical protein